MTKVDITRFREIALSADLYWPPATEVKTGRWAAVDKHINIFDPKTVLTLLDELEELTEQLDYTVR